MDLGKIYDGKGVDQEKKKPDLSDLYKAEPNIDKEIADWSAYAPKRGFKPIAEDVMTRAASSLSFGTAEKASAKLGELQGKGTYDELLAKRRQETEDAGTRLGGPGAFASDIAGGLLTGSALQRAGVTLAGRLPAAAPLWQKAGLSAVEGAGYGAAHGAGHTDTGLAQDYINNILKGGTYGSLLGAASPYLMAGAQRVLTPFPAANPARAGLVQTLDNAGVDTTAGQRTGNSTLRMMEDYMAKLPFGRMFGGSPGRDQMQQVTQAAMGRAGIPAQPGVQATPDVINAGFQRVGGAIGQIQDRYHVNVDNHLLNRAVQLESELPLLQPGQQGTARHFLDRLTSGQTLTPEVAQTTRTQLGRAIRAQNGPAGDKVYQEQLTNIRNALDGALERTIQGAGNHGEVQALRELRQQYANLHTLSDAIGSSGAAGQAGTLTPSALASAASRSVGKTNYTRGRGDLNELGRASAGLLQSPPDSGTATRLGMLDLHKALLSPAAALVNRGLPQRYLGNQVAPLPASGAALPGPVAGAVAGGEAPDRPVPGPVDRIMKGLLGVQ